MDSRVAAVFKVGPLDQRRDAVLQQAWAQAALQRLHREVCEPRGIAEAGDLLLGLHEPQPAVGTRDPAQRGIRQTPTQLREQLERQAACDADPASAAASAPRSMPTGHHVTHRPQPTQPVAPNWGCQVASLCAAH